MDGMQGRTGIVVMDGARARFIGIQVPEDEAIDGGPRLVEHSELVNPDGDTPARGLFSDRSGRAHASAANAAHGLDDHRDRHQAEIDRRFARQVYVDAERFVAEQQLRRLILVAPPRLLGVLRTELGAEPFRNVELVELNEDLSRQPLRHVHATLAARGLVKPPQRPEAGVYRPRGQAASWR
jgi:protein required for attachment to host cells